MFLRSLTTEAMGIWRYPIFGMFHLRERSLSPSDKVNAGAKPAEYLNQNQRSATNGR